MMSRRPQRVPRGDPGHRAHGAARGTLLQPHGPAQAAAEHPHGVLLYRDDAALADAIGAWAEAGLRNGEGVLLVVRDSVREPVRAWLRGAELDPAALEATGQLRFLDADGTLRLFMVGGRPQPNLFTNAIAPIVSDLKAASPAGEVRAWGEMVDLLWKRAQGAAAVALEGLWSDLLAAQGFRLFCAYQVDAFDALQFPKVRTIAASHGRLLATEDEARFAAAVDAAFRETYGPEADTVRTFLGPGTAGVPTPLHHLLALHDMTPAFGALVAARAGGHYRAPRDHGAP
jgi:hypothetical protein